MKRPNFLFEKKLSGPVCGIDEAGRGPWAGPVVAAAVILNPECFPRGMNDSKLLTAEMRERLHLELLACAEIGIGMASVEEIDRFNILGATMLAMLRACEALPQMPVSALVDGNRAPKLPCQVHTIVQGDGKSLSIAAASIMAKVTRDRIMRVLAADHPEYGFERHVGYGTPEHQRAIAEYGVTPHHRRSFAPIREALGRMPEQHELPMEAVA